MPERRHRERPVVCTGPGRLRCGSRLPPAASRHPARTVEGWIALERGPAPGCRDLIGNALFCALVLAGCAVGPDYHRPPPGTLPAQWKAGSPWKEGQPRDAEIKQSFWEVFDDAVLTELEQEADRKST